MRASPPRTGPERGATRRQFVLGAAGLVAAPAFIPRVQASEQLLGVVEMFTSQGCSSCPPADAVLAALIEEGKVIGLSHHVDYWDYLGWRDTLGSKEATKRQYAYASAFGRRGVYTPQAVVNGRTHLVGSRGAEIATRLQEDRRAGQAPLLPVTVERRGKTARVGIEGAPGPDIDIVAMFYLDTYTERIESGENHGRTITYHHPVREIRRIGPWTGQAPTFELTPGGQPGGVAVLAQQRLDGGLPGPVLGAGVLPVGVS